MKGKNRFSMLPLVAALGLAWAAELPAQPPAPGAVSPAREPVWLGVAVSPVPEAVKAQLPEEAGGGLLVRQVVKDSPADRAGLRRHDVLVRFNGQPLSSPRDLVQRVRNSRPGDKITLEVVRGGQVRKVEATLESRRPPVPRHRRPTPPRTAPAPGVQSRVWESFQSLSVVKNPDGKYTAVVEFLDDEGNRQRLEYQGTRDEISAQVRQEKALPEGLRRQLLDALSDRVPDFPMEFPAFPEWPRFPAFDDDFFAPPPWWNRQGPRGFWD